MGFRVLITSLTSIFRSLTRIHSIICNFEQLLGTQIIAITLALAVFIVALQSWYRCEEREISLFDCSFFCRYISLQNFSLAAMTGHASQSFDLFVCLYVRPRLTPKRLERSGPNLAYTCTMASSISRFKKSGI